MHIIPSFFPSLYDWGFWVPLFFRLFLAYQLYREAKRLMSQKDPQLVSPNESVPTPSARKTLAWMMMALSFLFFVGLGVQLIAVFTAVAYLVRALQISKKSERKESLEHLLVLSALVAFSLLFLGPGPYAVDLPL